MKILPINSLTFNRTVTITENSKQNENYSNYLTKSNSPIGFYMPFMGKTSTQKFELAYQEEELKNRVQDGVFTPYVLLDSKSDAYKKLAPGDKMALKHLIKASMIMDTVYKRQDNIHNLEFEKYLTKEIKSGNRQAVLTKKLYDGQKGICGRTVQGAPVSLAKNITETIGKGFYPEDLTVDEFHNILTKMINDDEIDEVKNILNQHSMVFRSGDKLKAVDYTEYFQKEFKQIAKELDLAAETVSDDDFSTFLSLQARALRNNNPLFDCAADKKWATLQDSQLEFTVGRECYDDRMTPTVTQNPELKALLDKHNIVPYAKDSLGIRVGIVDKEGTDYLLKVKEFLPFMASKMPFNKMYKQNVSTKSDLTMVDIDVVHMSGRFGAYRGGISLASILPNSDKLSAQTGGGHRAVYHKQMRQAKYSDNMDKKLDVLLVEEQRKYFNEKALHDFTILHENVHSLGPKEGLERLGVYKNIIEEHKADMGALVMLDELRQKGFYSMQQEKEFITSYITAYVLKGANFSDAHAHRNMLQYNYFIKNNAIEICDDGKMKIDYKNVIKCAHSMLRNAIKIQLSQDAQTAKNYIDEYAVWTEDLAGLAEKLNSVDRRLNSFVVTPMEKIV